MMPTTDNKKNNRKLKGPNEEAKNIARHKQNETDPQLTELKGFIDPNEDLEPDRQDMKSPITLTN
jgi:hypothetical protein